MDEPVLAQPSAVERLLAYEEIRQLAHRYAVYLDARDIDALVQLYVPGVPISPKRSGREALAELFDSAMRSVGLTFLLVGSHAIDLADDLRSATGIVYTRADIQDGGPNSERWITHAIHYHDTYTRHEGRWYFAANRDHRLVYGAELGDNPLNLPPANWPRNQTGLGSTPQDLESWQRFWNE